jgi:hypothetical protein
MLLNVKTVVTGCMILFKTSIEHSLLQTVVLGLQVTGTKSLI